MGNVEKGVSRPIQFALAAWSVLWVVLGAPSASPAGQFRAAVVKTDITPNQSVWLLGYDPRQSTGVHDRLYLRIVAMDDGDTQFFLIASDICEISPSLYDDVAARLQTQTGIKPVQVWWTTTHTHSAPEVGPPGLSGAFLGQRYQHDHNSEYTAWVEQQLIDGIKEARANLAPARLGVGWGTAFANINRRA
ncbi:MAG TPA: neutral/alkaline non-lysosomal ceramidase N-terminal domain-containing protein, partial [Desulfobaccales bacterium]